MPAWPVFIIYGVAVLLANSTLPNVRLAPANRVSVSIQSISEVVMLTARLPITVRAPREGWIFHGSWSAAERTTVEHTLRERIPNPTQALADPWLFLAHDTAYYAHSPCIHSAGMGYCAASTDDLV